MVGVEGGACQPGVMLHVLKTSHLKNPVDRLAEPVYAQAPVGVIAICGSHKEEGPNTQLLLLPCWHGLADFGLAFSDDAPAWYLNYAPVRGQKGDHLLQQSEQSHQLSAGAPSKRLFRNRNENNWPGRAS